MISVERSDEGGKSAYEVKVKHAGTVTEVNLDSSLRRDRPAGRRRSGRPEASDGDGKTNDDGGAQGDAETNETRPSSSGRVAHGRGALSRSSHLADVGSGRAP